MKKRTLFILILLLALMPLQTSHADSGYTVTVHQIINSDSKGNHYNIKGNRISIYRVDRYDDSLEFIKTVETDSEGYAVFRNIPKGHYVIKDDKNMRYSIVETHLKIDGSRCVNVKSSDNTNIDIEVPVNDEEKPREEITNKKTDDKVTNTKTNEEHNTVYNKKYVNPQEKSNILMPRTGQIEIFVYTLGGLLIFLIGLFIYRKDRKNEQR